ncbi:Putative helicase [Paraburkholderia unamae]|uniref:AAA family ATPase n=1 Tax=Paraburkholderia unamae TaxID=219649 RepID=UPI001CAC8A6C|nr:AAA family ATPase [Paraburkholderia unamae]CAG9257963.1 Putative helicase [Paraburkholderia unamae]
MSPAERAKSALFSFPPGGSHDENTKLGVSFKKAGGDFADFDEWRAQDPENKGTAYNRSQWRSYDGLDQVGPHLLYFLAGQENDWRDPDPGPPPSSHRTNGSGGGISHVSEPDEDTGERAVDLWLDGKPAHAHPYVTAKGLRDACDADRLRVAAHDPGCLLVPIRALSDAAPVVAVQRVFADGTKRTLGKLTPFPGCCYVIGELCGGVTVIGCEGMATGEAIAWACPDAAVVVSIGVSREREVMAEIRAKYPASPRVIVADRGRHACDASEKQPADHIETLTPRAAQETRSAWVSMPAEVAEGYDAWDFVTDPARGPDALAVWIAGGGRHEYVPRYKLLDGSTVAAQPVLPDLVHNVVPARAVVAVWGTSGAAKSFLVQELAACMEECRPFFGHAVFERVPVVMLSLEGNNGLPRRYLAWENYNSRPVPWLTISHQSFSLLESHDIEDLCEAIEQTGEATGLLVIDPLALCTVGLEENSSAEMGKAVAALHTLRDRTGWTVCIVHHTGKQKDNGMRGSSNLPYLLDAHIEVTSDRESGLRHWSTGKQKEAEDGGPHAFRLLPVDIGEEPNGLTRFSCVIECTDAQERGHEPTRKPPGKPKSANQAIAYEVIGALLREGNSLGAGDDCPPDRPCVLLETATRAVAAKLFQYEERRRYNVAKSTLSAMQTKFYACDGNWLWLKPDGG